MMCTAVCRIRKRVFHICSTYGAFAATKTVPWMDCIPAEIIVFLPVRSCPTHGSCAGNHILANLVRFHVNCFLANSPPTGLSCRPSFQKLTHAEDGSVVTWGDADWGGNSSTVQDQLYMISCVSGTFRAFLDLRESGTFFLGDDASWKNLIVCFQFV